MNSEKFPNRMDFASWDMLSNVVEGVEIDLDPKSKVSETEGALRAMRGLDAEKQFFADWGNGGPIGGPVFESNPKLG